MAVLNGGYLVRLLFISLLDLFKKGTREMKQELDELLCSKYPKLFAQRNLPMTETCMCWGFECGDGWFDLIDELCGTIQSYIDGNNKPQIEVVQVKSKFGTLRFYIGGESDRLIDGMIWFAESMSGRIPQHKEEQHVLDAIEQGKALGYADGMMARPNNVVAMPCDELKKMQDQLAHLKKMIVWYQDITMTGINSTDYENGFWDAVDFVKHHQVKDKN